MVFLKIRTPLDTELIPDKIQTVLKVSDQKYKYQDFKIKPE